MAIDKDMFTRCFRCAFRYASTPKTPLKNPVFTSVMRKREEWRNS